MRASIRKATALCVVCMSLGTAPLGAQSWDLTTDWSDATNPFGAWSLYRGPGNLYPVNQPDFWGDGQNQRAWADAPFPTTPGHVPHWMKVTSLGSCGNCSNTGGPLFPGFVTAGTVVVSTSDPNSSHGPTSAGWTSPVSGLISINGGVWLNKNLQNRPQIWELFLNGTLLSFGNLFDGDPYTQSNPFLFANGSGGPSAVSFGVNPGDQVLLTVRRTAANGNLVGVDFRVSVRSSPIPEPATFILVGSALLMLVGASRLRRKGCS
jgi:hypothetical protein